MLYEVITIKKGTVIDSDMLETVTVGKYNLPANIVVNENDVVGKYAEADFFTGDYILSSKLAVELKTAEQILTSLDGNKTAMSISLKTFVITSYSIHYTKLYELCQQEFQLQMKLVEQQQQTEIFR